eukprot:3587377-Prymnesium_polylepis.1
MPGYAHQAGDPEPPRVGRDPRKGQGEIPGARNLPLNSASYRAGTECKCQIGHPHMTQTSPTTTPST